MKTLKENLSLDVVPEAIRKILTRFAENGFEVWVVGGALRDFCYGWTPKDWDLATDASPQQVIRLFPKVIPVGLRHGTVQVLTGKEKVEVTSYQSTDFQGILSDLQRRDFTVNALAFSYPGGHLIDPFGGQKDILSRTLRSVGDASCRFAEDPLRTLRAGRFMSVYGFDIDPETFAALKEAAPKLQRVSRERIREEFFKMLLGRHFIDAFGAMMRGGVIKELLPELAAQRNDAPGVVAANDLSQRAQSPLREEQRSDVTTDVDLSHAELIEHCVKAVYGSPSRLGVRLAALFHHLFELGPTQLGCESLPAQDRFRETSRAGAAIMRRLRSSRRLEQEVAFLLENQIPEGTQYWIEAEVRFFIAGIGPGLLEDVMDLASADRKARKDQSRSFNEIQKLRLRVSRELELRPPFRIEDLAIDGLDVMRILKLEPGPAVGEVLRKLHRQVLENPSLNEPKLLMDFLMKEYDIRLRLENER